MVVPHEGGSTKDREVPLSAPVSIREWIRIVCSFFAGALLGWFPTELYLAALASAVAGGAAGACTCMLWRKGFVASLTRAHTKQL